MTAAVLLHLALLTVTAGGGGWPSRIGSSRVLRGGQQEEERAP